jgi:UrcA family protein
MKLYALIAISMLACAGIAHAQEATLEAQTIKIADLDLSKSTDVAALKSRIYSTAVKMCKLNNDGKIYFKSNLDCIKDAVASTDAKVEMAIKQRLNSILAASGQRSVQNSRLAQQVRETRR